MIKYAVRNNISNIKTSFQCNLFFYLPTFTFTIIVIIWVPYSKYKKNKCIIVKKQYTYTKMGFIFIL